MFMNWNKLFSVQTSCSKSLCQITKACVRRFLAAKEQQERSHLQERHLHKLRLLGLHDNKCVQDALCNYFGKQLTKAVTEFLAKGLDYCFYLHHHILKS